MDLSENNDTNEVLVTQEDSLSVEEKRANSYEDVNNERTTENIEETPDSSISNEHVEAKCDSKNYITTCTISIPKIYHKYKNWDITKSH
jgi:hypothetical protein